MKKVNYYQLIGQSYILMKFLDEIDKNNFTSSEYFKNKFQTSNPNIKIILKNCKIKNRGYLMLKLYSSLVIAKELMCFKRIFDILNEKIYPLIKKVETSYPSDKKSIDYIRHIRNSISHAQITFENHDIIFLDKDKNNYRAKIIIEDKNSTILCEILDRFIEKYLSNK